MDFIQHLTGDEGHSTLRLIAPNDLHSLCRVSKASRLATTPALYRRVSLVFKIFQEAGMCSEQIDNYTECYRRQRLFCETIHQRPELAEFVRELSWTLSFPEIPDEPLPPWEEPYVDPEDKDALAELMRQHIAMGGPFQAPTDPFESARPPAIWETFSLLKDVRSLDLRMHHDFFQTVTTAPFDLTPTILFPIASTVKLSGPFDPEFAGRILSHNTSRIKTLELNHMMFRESQHEYKAYLGWSNIVQEALPSLTSLTLRKEGADSPDEPFDAAEEQKVFAELAKALETARESIEYIGLVSTEADHGCISYCISMDATPVSQGHFEQLVLPTLVKGCWPKLTNIALYGLWIPRDLTFKVGRGHDGKPCVISRFPVDEAD